MNIKQLIKELKELEKDYLETSLDLKLSKTTRDYYEGKKSGIRKALKYLNYLDKK